MSEKHIPFKALVCASVAVGGGLLLAGCGKGEGKQRPENGDTGIAKDTVSLVTNPKVPKREQITCDVRSGESVIKGRDSYFTPDNGITNADMTFIEGSEDCSGWSYNKDYLDDFDWNK